MPEVIQGQRFEIPSWEATNMVREIAKASDVERITLERTDGRVLAEVWLGRGDSFADLEAVVHHAASLVDRVVVTVERTGEYPPEDIARAQDAPIGDPQRHEAVTHPETGEPPLKGAGEQERQFEEGSGKGR